MRQPVETYTIKTFAGGGLPDNIPALAASFSEPQGVAADAAGNVFFASGTPCSVWMR